MENIKKYIPTNEEEKENKKIILDYILKYDNIYSRTNTIAHMTASSWVVDKSHTKVLMVYHNIYDSWSWCGGHCDGDTDTLSVAIRETKEETGINNIKVLNDGNIFSLEVLDVNEHYKRGQLVKKHLHLNVTYLLEASIDDQLHIKEDENSNVKWFKVDEVLNYVSEKYMINVYQKLIDKSKLILK